MRSDPEDLESPIDAYYVFVFSLLVLSFVLALKRVLERRRLESIAKGEIEDDLASEEDHRNLRSNDILRTSCEKISNEEYEYQKDNLTRSEINKLV